MEIQTDFKVGDLLETKYSDYGSRQMIAFEVAEIITVTCLAGTQVYYRCRAINFKLGYSEKRWTIERSGTHINMKEEYHKYRSDEVRPASQMIYSVLEDPMHSVELVIKNDKWVKNSLDVLKKLINLLSQVKKTK